MVVSRDEAVVVTGATGRQGGAVVRHLLAGGWRVRALTRRPGSPKARSLVALGAEVVRADMGDRESLLMALRGARGVYSVQNPYTAGGPEAEVHQGMLVADAAAAGVRLLVYGSAGTGQAGTGVDSWESKLRVEAYVRALGLPLTILRPMAFMELMTDRGYFPAASTWHVMPALMGENRPVGWLGVDDLGQFAAQAFAAPEAFVGRDLPLAADVQPIAACRVLYHEGTGAAPPRLPLPVWLFERLAGIAGKDLTTMWRWLRSNEITLDTTPARALLPRALDVRAWLARHATAARSR